VSLADAEYWAALAQLPHLPLEMGFFKVFLANRRPVLGKGGCLGADPRKLREDATVEEGLQMV
jgi:hypothetical protein